MGLRNLKPHLLAEIYYLSAEEGGRQNPVASNYRGNLVIKGNYFMGVQEFVDKDICLPGQSVLVNYHLILPENHKNSLYVGEIFEIREGDRLVGKGVIKGIFDENLIDMSKTTDKSFNGLKIVSKSVQDEMDKKYWHSKTPEERFRAFNAILTSYIILKYESDPGFQRVFRITKQK